MTKYDKHIKIRVPEKMLERIEKETDRRGINRSEFVRFAIEKELPKIKKEENKMENIINDYVTEELLEQAREIKEEHAAKNYDRNYIRIGIHATGHPTKREDIYFVSPDSTVTNGPVFHSQGDSHYRNQNIGDIQLRVIYNIEFTTIQVDRIIQPVDEDMSYADDFQEPLFPDLTLEYRENYSLPDPQNIVKCVECGEQYLYSQDKVGNGEYMTLDEGTEIICSDCGNDYTIGEYLESLDPEEKEKISEYLLDICSLEKDDPLVL